MATPRGLKISTPDAVFSTFVGVISLLTFMIWVGYCTLGIIINSISIGDGASRGGPTLESGLLWFPSLYLLIVLSSALPFVRRWSLVFAAMLGHVLLVPSLLLVAHSHGLEPVIIRSALATFTVVDLFWLTMIGLRFRTYAA